MPTALVTGSGGLIGSESVSRLVEAFGSQFGNWRPERELETILRELYEANTERWISAEA